MRSPTSPSVTSILPAAIFLMLVGWGGLYFLFDSTLPSGGARWVFFFAQVLALTGTALPLVAFLNRRFPTLPPPNSLVIVRQALWIGAYLPTLIWLQISRVLTPAMALLLLIGFLIIEWLLRVRERSQWRP